MLHDDIWIKVDGVLVGDVQPTEPTRPYNHWDPLHSERNPTPEWFARWEAQIPDLGCACRKGYAEIRQTWKPDFSSPEAFFASTVELHNLLNAKLGKPILTLEDALAIWRPQ